MVKVEERLVISMKIGDQPAVIKIIFNMHGIRKVSFYLIQPFKYCWYSTERGSKLNKLEFHILLLWMSKGFIHTVKL